jgi:hypothetical protein
MFQCFRVFGGWVWRKIFGPKRDELTEKWRRPQKEELYELYWSPDIVWVIK